MHYLSLFQPTDSLQYFPYVLQARKLTAP